MGRLACQEDWQGASSVVGSVALVASSKTYNTVMEECVCEESVCVCQTIPLTQSLSTPQPDFETDQRTWSNCLLLHQLLIIGDEEQVLSRREELDRDLLLQTCSFTVIPGQGRRSSYFSES